MAQNEKHTSAENTHVDHRELVGGYLVGVRTTLLTFVGRQCGG